jgi:replication factor C subunit 1
MLTHKYKPDNLENIIGNKTCINSIQLWFEKWYPVKTNSKDVCALLSGSNGIGKTLTIELLIKKYNLNPISLNPDEKADKEHIVNVILPSIQRGKSITNKQNIFVIHDIDCYDDYGFISSIVNCLKETKIPVIATCNNRYDQSLKPLISYCLDIKFQKPNAADIVKFVKPILKKQSISMSDANLNQLIEDSNCDIRSILNNLELLGGNVNINTNTKDKTNSNIFEVTKQFMSQTVELNDKQILFWMNNDILPLMIHENYPVNNIKMKNEVSYLHNISESIHSLSDIDLFEKDIHMNSNWELMPYTSWFSMNAVANCHAKTMIKFTSFFEKRASKKQTMTYNDTGYVDNHISKSSSKIAVSKKGKQNPTPSERKVVTKSKVIKPKETKVKKSKEVEITEVQEKPKKTRRPKVKLIIEE